MHVKKHVVNVTTASDGSAEAYTNEPLNGQILKVMYNKASSNAFDDGVDISIRTEETGQALWEEDDVNASKSVSPVEKRQDSSGDDATYDGTNAIYGSICAAFERLKISITDGGSKKDGQFVILEG